jgi:hypothetical protein
MPLYPSIVLRAKERASIPCPSVVFSLGFTFESRKEFGVHHNSFKLLSCLQKCIIWRQCSCNLEIMLDGFCGWRVQTLIQLGGWIVGDAVLQWCRKICLWWFFVFGVFCRLRWRELGELASEMQCNLSYSMKFFEEFCEIMFLQGDWLRRVAKAFWLRKKS